MGNYWGDSLLWFRQWVILSSLGHTSTPMLWTNYQRIPYVRHLEANHWIILTPLMYTFEAWLSIWLVLASTKIKVRCSCSHQAFKALLFWLFWVVFLDLGFASLWSNNLLVNRLIFFRFDLYTIIFNSLNYWFDFEEHIICSGITIHIYLSFVCYTNLFVSQSLT